MKYTQPIGGAANDPYVDANPATGVEGSPVPAAAIEDPQREIVDVITYAQMVPDENNLTQLRQAILKMITDAEKPVIDEGATFEASVANGEAVRWDAANTRYDEAVADGTVNNLPLGFADVTNGRVYLFGECPLFAGLTPGARYYLSGTTPGAITTVAPANPVMVGIAKSATMMFVDIDPGGGGLKTFWFPADAMIPRTTSGAASGTVETAVNKVMFKTLDFDAAVAEYAQFQVEMPKSWDRGTVTVMFLWSNASGVGDVVWGIQAVAISNDDVLDAAFGAAQTVTDSVTAAGDLMISAKVNYDIAGVPAIDDVVQFQLYRDAANGADTLAVDARLHGVALFYTTTTNTDA